MRAHQLMLGILAVSVLVGGFAAGQLLAGAWQDRQSPATPAPSLPVPTATLPSGDVPGEDLPGLPRFPGSVRTAFERAEIDRVTLTTAEYLADAAVDEVRHFYQERFEEQGWTIADLGISLGSWTFVVHDASREATVEIGDASGLTEIRITLTETLDPTPRPTPEPTRPPPPPPAPDDDDDDDDDADDDGDDTDDDGPTDD